MLGKHSTALHSDTGVQYVYYGMLLKAHCVGRGRHEVCFQNIRPIAEAEGHKCGE